MVDALTASSPYVLALSDGISLFTALTYLYLYLSLGFNTVSTVSTCESFTCAIQG